MFNQTRDNKVNMNPLIRLFTNIYWMQLFPCKIFLNEIRGVAWIMFLIESENAE